jgi:hypothetical protein
MVVEKIKATGTRLVTGARGLVPSIGSASLWRKLGLGLLIIVLLYYPIGMLVVHNIDDDPDFQASENNVVEGGSKTVAVAAALIERETDIHRWVANDPFFLPAAALDNMPNFQKGVISALARVSFELVDQIGRTRGSSETDPNLQEASGKLQYAGDVWVFDFSTSIAPVATSEAQYRAARRSLLKYNRRLANGEAIFERRADNLMATLDRIALDIGSSSAAIDSHVVEKSGQFIDFEADDVFYNVKGQIYAYYLILRELQVDYADLIHERGLDNAWEQMLESMRTAATVNPWVVVNGNPSGQFLPSHLAAQGFFLLRARTRLREITNILLK